MDYFTDTYNGSARHQINLGVFLSFSNCIIVKGFTTRNNVIKNPSFMCTEKKRLPAFTLFLLCVLKGVENLKTLHVLMRFATFFKVLGVCSKHFLGNSANCLPLAWSFCTSLWTFICPLMFSWSNKKLTQLSHDFEFGKKVSFCLVPSKLKSNSFKIHFSSKKLKAIDKEKVHVYVILHVYVIYIHII